MNAHFVLVHGFSHGGWCWYKIKYRLENLGYKVSCPDLKASGIDQTDSNTVLSFKDYNKPLIDLLSISPPDEKVILVGHNIAGLKVTDATDRFGKKINYTSHLSCSYHVQTRSHSSGDYRLCPPPDFSKFGPATNVFDMNYGFGPEKLPTSVVMKKEFQHEIFYYMSPQEDVTLASMLLRPGPNYAIKNVRFTDDDNHTEKAHCIYINTIHDQLMRAEKQENMIDKGRPWKTYDIESDHCPFFSAPDDLVNILVDAAASVGLDALHAPNS